jgi:hypothetical protein
MGQKGALTFCQLHFTVPNTLKLKQRTPGHVYVPYEVREEAENRSQEQQVCETCEEQKS